MVANFPRVIDLFLPIATMIPGSLLFVPSSLFAPASLGRTVHHLYNPSSVHSLEKAVLWFLAFNDSILLVH